MDAPANLRLHDNDDVLIALAATKAPDGSAIPSGHKIAARAIPKGAGVRKYGQVIGLATQAITEGAHVHSHNLSVLGVAHAEISLGQASRTASDDPSTDMFQGYHRATGKVGTRNYVGILTSVNCAGSVARFIAEAATRQGLLEEFPNVDGIVPIAHGAGCGLAAQGEGYDTLFRTLAGYAQNPNFGAVLMVGLGCEVMQLPALVSQAQLVDSDSFQFMTIQNSGGTTATVNAGVKALRALMAEANQTSRQPAPVSALTLGMQCGGSDGLSGITANPALGAASDLLVAQGGTSILSETPEIYGAEHLLTARAASPDVAQALLDRLDWWEGYCARNGAEMDNNPSPGNKRGGLTTILEKSLGAVAKAGAAPLNGVYLYGQQIDRPGLVFMDSPGYDPCSVTGQVASGANLIAFTTGRGSVSGYQPVPGLKLASNSDLATRMAEDMDIDCGDITQGISIQQKGREIYDALLATASGQRTSSECLGFGGVEFVPWQIGAVM